MTEEQVSESVLRRVRKMLALSKDTAASEGERDNALRMAHAVLAKYNLSLGDAEVTEEPRIEDKAQLSPHPWARGMIDAIAQLYFCKTIFYRYPDKRQVHHFIGRQSNVITAIEMCRYILTSINKEARKGAKESPWIIGYERAFCKGASSAVWRRCIQIRDEADHKDDQAPTAGTALVLASLYRTELEKNMLAITEKHGVVSIVKSRQRAADRDAFNAGQQYGNKINLNHQVTSGTTQNRLQ